MKKNIEWLKKEIEEVLYSAHLRGEHTAMQSNAMYDDIVNKINQLDEPEANSQINKLANFIMSEVEGEPSQNQGVVDTAIRIIKSYQNQETLSQEWIDDNKSLINGRSTNPDGTEGECYDAHYIHVLELQNLLVPTLSEMEKVADVIPNYVAKWISVHHEQFDLYPALKRLENNALSWEDVYEWYRRNTHTFVNAYLTGEYEVEEEQKYYALIKGHENIGSDDKYWNYCITDKSLDIGDNKVHADVLAEYVLSATKDEWENLGINDDNADFVKVEELEE